MADDAGNGERQVVMDATPVALSTMLSQALVAFTIEFDNEAEHRLTHWTTSGGKSAAPRGATWLVSQVMWANVLQYRRGERESWRQRCARQRRARRGR